MSAGSPSSPRLARWLLARLLPAAEREFLIGDLEETFAAALAAGMPPRIARRAYWRAAVNSAVALRTTAPVRWSPGTPRPERLRRTLGAFKDAARALMHQPGYAVLVAATLAIGIGVTTVMFAVAHWLVLRPIAGVHDPDRLVTVWASIPVGLRPISEGDRAALEAQSPSFEGLAGYVSTPIHVLAGTSREATRLQAQIVSDGYFDLVGARVVMRGRGFSKDEAAVAVISHRTWRRDFGADPSVVGRAFIVNSQPVTVVGVATQGFHGVQRTDDADVWMPIAGHRVVMPIRQGNLVSDRRAALYYALVGRLRSGASPEGAERELAMVLERLNAANPTDPWIRQARFVVDAAYSTSPLPIVRARVTGSVTILFTAAVLLLALTCANAGGLILTRTLSRRREIAVRLALGATRGMVLRQDLVESLVLTSMGAALALVAAGWALFRLRGTVIYPSLPALGDVGIDARVFGFAVGVAALAGVAASLLPAISTSRSNVNALNMSSRATTSRSHRVVRRTLTIAQAALSVVLLLATVLLFRSLAELHRIDPGFDTRSLVAFAVEPGLQGYSGPEREAYYRSLMLRVRETPGVRAAAIAWWRPFFPSLSRPVLRTVERPNDEGIRTEATGVDQDYFSTLGISLLDGRGFAETDSQEGGRIIVNESLARRLFGTTAVAGRPVLIEGRKAPAEIVGVAADVRSRLLHEPAPPQMYSPFRRTDPSSGAHVLVRTSDSPERLMPQLRDAVHALDATAPVVEMLTLSEAIDVHLAEPLLLGRLSGVFAFFAALLTGLGIYGLFGRMVVERRPEFAIRSALGATPGGVLRLIVSDALRLALVAVTLGMGAAYWLVPLLRERLFGVSPFDGPSFAAAGAGIVVVALVASIAPARRAARVDPLTALRE